MTEPKPDFPAARGRRWRALRDSILLQEDLNFLLTNRIPRIAASRFLGWFTRIRHPLVRGASMALWRAATDLDLSDALKSRFDSVHDCFTRELRPGARPLDPDPAVLLSPSDGIVGEHGIIRHGQMLQAKGMPYTLPDLLGDEAAARASEGCCYVTIRLTSAMYHRFHAPQDGMLVDVNHLDGDTWNVNPIALKRVERLFCRNERAVLRLQVEPAGATLRIVAVAAIGVSGLRLRGIPDRMRAGDGGLGRRDLGITVRRGEELGGFEHGSTLVILAPPGHVPRPGLAIGDRLRMGERLLVPGEVPEALSWLR